MFTVPGVGMGGAPLSPVLSVNGVPIAMLGGVFGGGLPVGGPVTELFRGGAGPVTPGLFASTITPSGPIEAFLLGAGGAPIGVGTFQGGGLPIGAPPPVQLVEAQLQPRTAQVGATLGPVPPPAVSFGPSIGSLGGIGAGAAAIGAPAPSGGSPIGGSHSSGTPQVFLFCWVTPLQTRF